MMRYRVLVAVAVGASSVLVGCGGAESNSAQVSSVAHRYFVALGSGNGSELCSLITGEAKQRLIRSGAVFITHRSKTLGCPEVAKVAHLIMGSDQAAEARKVKVRVRSLSGNDASVRVTLPRGRSILVPMTKTAAGWLIELGVSVPGAGGQSANPAFACITKHAPAQTTVNEPSLEVKWPGQPEPERLSVVELASASEASAIAAHLKAEQAKGEHPVLVLPWGTSQRLTEVRVAAGRYFVQWGPRFPTVAQGAVLKGCLP